MNVTNDNSASGPRQQKIVLKTPHGELHLKQNDAHDHAHMRAQQLQATLVLISGEGLENFSFLNSDLRNSLLWMLSQAAGELDQLLAQVSFADIEVSK